MSNQSVLHIGIAPREVIKQRTIAIAKGTLHPLPGEPRAWFTSFESLAKVLSERNMLLLEIIRNSRPRSVTELANLSGRAKSNLSRTLSNMERLGLIELKNENHRKVPTVKYDRVQFEFALGNAAGPKQAA